MQRLLVGLAGSGGGTLAQRQMVLGVGVVVLTVGIDFRRARLGVPAHELA